MEQEPNREQAGETANGEPLGVCGTYASPSIMERRRRILSSARKLIAVKGLDEVSMEEIAIQSGVAKKTLYNAFESRDILIAASIQQYFQDYERRIVYETPPATPERIVEHLSIVVKRNLAVRDYTRKLLTIFFTAPGTGDVHRAIFEIAAHSHRPWIEKLNEDDQLHPWIDPVALVGDLVRCRYAIGLDWAHGRIEDHDFAPHVIGSVLTMVAGASRQTSRRKIDAVLRTVAQRIR